MRAHVVTEAIRRQDDECVYGTLERRKGRVIFTYTDMTTPVYDVKFGCIAPADIRKVYPDIASR